MLIDMQPCTSILLYAISQPEPPHWQKLNAEPGALIVKINAAQSLQTPTSGKPASQPTNQGNDDSITPPHRRAALFVPKMEVRSLGMSRYPCLRWK